MKLKSVRNIDVRGKRVLLRASLNVPLEGARVTDTFRIRKALPTILFLSERGAKLVLIAHLGRSGASLRPVYEELQKELPEIRIIFSTASPGPELLAAQEDMRDGDVLMLENIRREKGEEEGERGFAERLAASGDLFVQDAFADMHRAHASISVLPTLLPSCAGLLVEEEVVHLAEALSPSHPAVAIFGGAKFETKVPLLTRALSVYDYVLLGGALVNDYFVGQGYEVGISNTSGNTLMEMGKFSNLKTPTDIVVSDEASSRITLPQEVRIKERIVDIGPQTTKEWIAIVESAAFVLWNGPLGIYERGYNQGTEALAHAIARSGVRGVVGGGDTIAAICKQDFDEKKVYVSTGGGAMLQFLADGMLPGLSPLGFY